MNDMENILDRLARVERYAVTASNLLGAAEDAHCERTLDGWLNHYIQKGAGGKEQAALCWMRERYELISASVRAAQDLSEIVREQVSDIGLDLRVLLPEEDC